MRHRGSESDSVYSVRSVVKVDWCLGPTSVSRCLGGLTAECRRSEAEAAFLAPIQNRESKIENDLARWIGLISVPRCLSD